MTFEEWFKDNYNSYIYDVELTENDRKTIAQNKVRNLLEEAWNAGYNRGWNESIDQHEY